VVSAEDDEGVGTPPIGSTLERGLLNAALDFYGAAEAVIDYTRHERPRLRYDINGLQAVRAAMTALEERIRLAQRGGLSAQRIAALTRLELDVVRMILERRDDTAPSADE
jgi:hypothetical protein